MTEYENLDPCVCEEEDCEQCVEAALNRLTDGKKPIEVELDDL